MKSPISIDIVETCIFEAVLPLVSRGTTGQLRRERRIHHRRVRCGETVRLLGGSAEQRRYLPPPRQSSGLRLAVELSRDLRRARELRDEHAKGRDAHETQVKRTKTVERFVYYADHESREPHGDQRSHLAIFHFGDRPASASRESADQVRVSRRNVSFSSFFFNNYEIHLFIGGNFCDCFQRIFSDFNLIKVRLRRRT